MDRKRVRLSLCGSKRQLRGADKFGNCSNGQIAFCGPERRAERESNMHRCGVNSLTEWQNAIATQW
jgi:hypothetical protein